MEIRWHWFHTPAAWHIYDIAKGYRGWFSINMPCHQCRNSYHKDEINTQESPDYLICIMGIALPRKTVIILTHEGPVMHICISKLTITGSDNGLSLGWCQAIIWNNDGIFLFEPLGTNFNEILIEIYTFSFKKMHLKIIIMLVICHLDRISVFLQCKSKQPVSCTMPS